MPYARFAAATKRLAHATASVARDATERARAAGAGKGLAWVRACANGGARFRCLAASLLVAIAASGFGAPALAQMAPAHCTPSDPLELWCATLTVERAEGRISVWYGYTLV